jgi:hypothetical protein
MEKYLVTVTYLLGIGLLGLAFVLRALNITGHWLGQSFRTGGSLVDYASFLDGAAILLLASIASAGYAWVKKQNP